MKTRHGRWASGWRAGAAIVAGLIVASSGCGSSDAMTPASQADAAADSGSTVVEQPSSQASPEGLCKVIPPADVARELGISVSDVQACSVTGGDPSPAAGARLLGSGKYGFYTLYLTPDEDQSIWSVASSGADLYEIDGRSCFDYENTSTEGYTTVSVQCSNPPAKNVVTFGLDPLPRSQLPSDALARAHAVAVAVFPKVFAYRGGD
jgi:hypothetical protein